jgi:hypothetical protein
MRNGFRKVILLAVALLLAVGLGSTSSAYAQNGTPPGWGQFVNEDGSINFDALGEPVKVTQPVDWMSFGSPVGDIPVGWPPGEATYLQYTTPDGGVLVVPSPATMLMTYLNADASGFAGSTPSRMGNGFDIVAQLLGGVVSADDVASLGYASPEDFFTSLANGQVDSGKFTALFMDTGRMMNFLWSLGNMQGDLGNLVNALWLYPPGLDCSAIPGGCPPGYGQNGDCLTNPAACTGGRNPGITPCPAATVQQGEFTATAHKTAPNYPMVVGQDKDKRGVDIQITVTNPPVIFTWYEAIFEDSTCEYDRSGKSGGCPGPGDQYGSVTDANGHEVSWGSNMAGSRFWSASAGEMQCIQHVEVLPDPIVNLTAFAQLSPASKNWILTDLAQKYYDAYIHQERFDLVPDMATPVFGCDASGVCSAAVLVEAVPFADPGMWLVDMNGATAGTSFQGVTITQPRSLFMLTPQQVEVYVLLESLVSP